MNRIPTRSSNSVFVTVIAGWRRLVPDGSCRRRLSIALRISCRIPCEWTAAWCSWEREVGTWPIAWSIWVMAAGTTR
jgi:hypothetical protein